MNTRIKALVVEDDEFQRNVLLSLLRYTQGICHASGVGTAEEALSAVRQRDYDVMFLDLGLPDVDGMGVLRALGDQGFLGSVAIVSAMDEEIMESVVTLAGMYGIKLLGAVRKPVTIEIITCLLENHDAAGSNALTMQATRTLSEAEVAAALQDGCIIPYYQPKVDLKAGRVVGFEALARLRQDDGTIIGPTAFIPAMEQSGQIDLLAATLVDQVFFSQHGRMRDGHVYTFSINLSLRQRELTGFLDRLDRYVRQYAIAPECIIVEVTESAIEHNVTEALETLTRIRMHGFGLSIDDYGTGFSSLEQLQRLPFSELKIDRSFVSGAAAGGRKRTILESSLEMAVRLNLKTVCEGVETMEEYMLVQQLGGDLAQGHFICKPICETDIPDFLRLWETADVANC